MIRNLIALPALALLLLAAAANAAPSRATRVTADGGGLRAEMQDGRVLTGAQLAGTVLRFQGLEVRVEDARQDEGIPGAQPGQPAGDIWLYRLSLRGADGEWAEPCDGGALGMVFPGPEGALRLTCSSSAIGTCIRYGYRPWARTAEGVALAPYHRACVNLLRSAEGGQAAGIYDRIGIQRAPAAPGSEFAAGWTSEGAACLAQPEAAMPGKDDQADIALAIMAIAGRMGRDQCTEERAAALGALVFNRSLPRG
ncbi:ADYC domain-containing protein [Roseococcus sp. YIM B11640]|uniref:ADYC domain-containing protein n=1 Tax=Roseococcus sp. YIM B11640 TaxID=3133973 RepID=UPI003C79804B